MRESWKENGLRVFVAVTLVGFGGLCVAVGAPPKAPVFPRDVHPILTRHCLSCHGARDAAAGLDLTRYPDASSLRADRRTLRKIVERVRAGEMPPPGQPALPAVQRAALVAWGSQNLAAGNGTTPDPGPPQLRRLTRIEYENTLQDLLGVPFATREEVGMADEVGSEGFDNVAAALDIPTTLMEKYLAAADKILDRVSAGKDGNETQKAYDALFFTHPAPGEPPRVAARKILERFTRLAYRRPVGEPDLAPLLRLWERGAASGKPFEESLRPALKAVLVSPYFLFRVEANRAGVRPGTPYPVDDYALASRLSYFLWSRMPDSTLFDLASQHRLSDPAVLAAQTRRMLADPRARALTANFAAQWLQVRRLAQARPSTDFFPTFTPSMREAMYQETALFFDGLRTDDRSVLDLLQSDYTFVNEELAKNYGITGVLGDGMRRVSLSPENHRGGLLGMGSILAMNAHTYRTSPTLRGKWMLGVLFGTPPPPPPPGVSVIADEQKKSGATTFREVLAQHARNPACASCHQKMDPLGFALENYDAIGRWRTDQGGKPVDASAQMPTGERLRGADDLRQYVWKRRDAFRSNLAEQMTAYALGRALGPGDEPAIQQILAAMQANDNHFSTLVTEIVRSYPFRYRKNPIIPAPTGKESTL